MQVMLSLEMFETDAQTVMDEYLAGFIRERDLLKDGRAWPNFADYRPAVELAKAKGIPVICANAPRRYVSLVGREGRQALGSLPSGARAFLPPLPYMPASEPYRQRVTSLMRAAREAAQAMDRSPQHLAQQEARVEAAAAAAARAASSTATATSTARGPQQKGGECPYIGIKGSDAFSVSDKFLDAQTLWDAAMAHSIASALEEAGREGRRPLVVHVCGKAHIENGLGIPEHLRQEALLGPLSRLGRLEPRPGDAASTGSTSPCPPPRCTRDPNPPSLAGCTALTPRSC